MRIQLANLEHGKLEFAHVYQAEDLDVSDERINLCGSAAVSGQIRRKGADVEVQGHLETCVQVECDRCLKPIQLPVNSDFSLEYITGSEYEASHTAELTEDLMSVAVFDGESIDLDEIAKEQILLLVPTRSLCKEDCKGICLTCGADRNSSECNCQQSDIDPRWGALKNLVDGKS
jgi:uncharacterized protein